MFDQQSAASEISRRVASKIYDSCRSKKLQIPGFPDFGTALDALRGDVVSSNSRKFNVCIQQQDRLLVSQALAETFINTATTRDAASALIESHNAKFNPNGEFWALTERTGEFVN